MKFIELTEADLERFIRIPTFKTRLNTHRFNDLYYDPENKRFVKKNRHGKWFEIGIHGEDQEIRVYFPGNHSYCRITFNELEKQYPQITGLYDPTKVTRHEYRGGERPPTLIDFDQSETSFDASSVLADLSFV